MIKEPNWIVWIKLPASAAYPNKVKIYWRADAPITLVMVDSGQYERIAITGEAKPLIICITVSSKLTVYFRNSMKISEYAIHDASPEPTDAWSSSSLSRKVLNTDDKPLLYFDFPVAAIIMA